MKCLALNTTGDGCSVALDIDGARRQIVDTSPRQQSRVLPALVARVLAQAGIAPAALDRIVCCVGPGGFAAVRVGVAYAKGFALALDIPIAGVSSLALLAQGAVRNHGARRALAVLDARMGEVYLADYGLTEDGQLATSKERLCRPEEARFAASPDTPSVGCGSGWKRYGEMLQRACGTAPPALIDFDAVPEAADAFALLQAAAPTATPFLDAVELTPSYLRNHVALTLAERGEPPPAAV